MRQSVGARLINEDTGEEYTINDSEGRVVSLSLIENRLTLEEKIARKSLVSLKFTNGKIYLRDLGSEDGTYYKSHGSKEWIKIGENGSEFIENREKKKEMNKGIAVLDAMRGFEFMVEKKEVLKFTPRR